MASWAQKKVNIVIRGVGLILPLTEHQGPILIVSVACMKGDNGGGEGQPGDAVAKDAEADYLVLVPCSLKFSKSTKLFILSNMPKIKHRTTEILFKYLLIKIVMFWPKSF